MARRDAARLADDETAFGTTLRPFFEAADPYVERVERQPLFATARSRLARLRGSTWTVILTDDANRAEVRETVKVARRGDDHVLVFLAPRVLFGPDAMTDLDATYEAYREFETFRQDLATLDRVEAFEVAPGDRIGALLARQRRIREGGRRTETGAERGPEGGRAAAVEGAAGNGVGATSHDGSTDRTEGADSELGDTGGGER